MAEKVVKKLGPKKTVSKKPAAKKTVVKKPATKRPVVRKTVAKKPAAKKTVAKKTVNKKPVNNKLPVIMKPMPNGHPLLNIQQGPKDLSNNDLSTLNSLPNKRIIKPKDELFNWAFLGKHDINHVKSQFDEVLLKLKKEALDENWFFGKNDIGKYPILNNYLKYTFFRLKKEKKIIEKEQYATFNTGLVNKRYKHIYALFKKSSPPIRQSWEFLDFCVVGEDSGKILTKFFTKPYPERPEYFKTIDDMFYSPNAGKPDTDIPHILIENVSRLPNEFISKNCPKNFTLQNTSHLDLDSKEEYFTNLGSAIEKDTEKYNSMQRRFDEALDLAIERVKWNYKTAIPSYFPTLNKMSLLLPLALVNDDKADIALVVERQPSGNYMGHTILTLDMAYSNARLIVKPESDWLRPDEINVFQNYDEDN